MPHEGVSVWPVGAPDHRFAAAMTACERHHVEVRQAALDMGLHRADLVEAAEPPRSVVLQEVEQKPERRLAETIAARTPCGR